MRARHMDNRGLRTRSNAVGQDARKNDGMSLSKGT